MTNSGIMLSCPSLWGLRVFVWACLLGGRGGQGGDFKVRWGPTGPTSATLHSARFGFLLIDSLTCLFGWLNAKTQFLQGLFLPLLFRVPSPFCRDRIAWVIFVNQISDMVVFGR